MLQFFVSRYTDHRTGRAEIFGNSWEAAWEMMGSFQIHTAFVPELANFSCDSKIEIQFT
jgi:hypothetical protein